MVKLQQNSKKIVKEKVRRKAQVSLQQKDNLDTFDLSIVVDNNIDKCALCKVGGNRFIRLTRTLKHMLHVKQEGYLFGQMISLKIKNQQYGLKLNGLNELPRNTSDYLGIEFNHYDDTANDDIAAAELEDIDEGDDNDDEDVVAEVFDKECVWASPYSLQIGRRKFVHYYCALYSPMVSVLRNKWFNVRSEISRGQGLTCSTCGKRGATVGCMVKRCNLVVR